MDQEKRIMLAFAVSFAVLVLWQALFVKTPPRNAKAPAETSQPTQTSGQTSTASPAAIAEKKGQSGKLKAARKSEAPAALPIRQGERAEEFVVESDMYRVTLSTQGAVVKSWVLTKWKDQKDEPLDVVDDAACQQLGFPMSFSVPGADTSLAGELNQALYVTQLAKQPMLGGGPSGGSSTEPLAGSTLRPPVTLTFVYSNGKVEARKQFVFGTEYAVHVVASLRDGQHNLPVGIRWPGGFGDHSLPAAAAASTSVGFYETADGKVHEENLVPSFWGRFYGAVPRVDLEVNGPLLSAGLEDRFFAQAFLPSSSDAGFLIARRTWTPPDWKGQDKDKPKPIEATLATRESKPLSFGVAVVPKDLDVLRSFTPSLDGVVDFGFFGFVAKPIFLGLRYIYDHWVHNFGWAIVILTVLINIAMFPLKVKSIRSAQQMQKVAPLAKDIQDRYKQYKFNDPRKQRMNQEMMELYKKHGVNPMGGCLPMALQLPFLYGFYRVLYLSIELRHAPWLIWIKDLSAPDPYYVLPTLMVITMFALQKITPMPSTDPGQKRMMLMMPLFMGALFYNFAAGLNLYYLTANIVGMAQQYFINLKMPGPSLADVPPRRNKGEKDKAEGK
jgi:YidC/Oxa1 family membrane protein insertase